MGVSLWSSERQAFEPNIGRTRHNVVLVGAPSIERGWPQHPPASRAEFRVYGDQQPLAVSQTIPKSGICKPLWQCGIRPMPCAGQTGIHLA
jgi:hypothetical protein